jgi:hypothetical protein
MSSQLQVSGEAKIRDIQGPVVANSGVITALDGAANQYVRGDGTLAIFPTSSGGGSSVSYYLNGSVNQGTFGGSTYYQMSRNAIVGTGTNFSTSSDGLIAQFITDANDPDVVSIPSGNWNVEFFMSVSASSGALASFYVEIYKYNGSTFTLLATNVATPEQLTNTTTVDAYFTSVAMPLSAMAVTDRLAVRVFANVASKTVTLYTEDNRLCQIVTTFSNGLTSLNNLTDQSQYLTTGTSGTDFNIVSSGDTHTFNLPSASASNRGLITTGAQTIAGAKVFDNPITANSGIGFLNDVMPNITSNLYTGIGGNSEGISIITRPFSTNYTNNLYFGLNNNSYTFPDATGTIALTSDLSSYVPYTGATGSVNLGLNNLTANNVFGETSLNVKILPSGSVFSTGYSVLSSLAGKFTMAQEATAGNLKAFTFDFSAWATNTSRTYTLPDLSGTLALLEGSQTFTGDKLFNGAVDFNNSVNINSGLFIRNNVIGSTLYTSFTITKASSTQTLSYLFSTGFASNLLFNDAANYSYTFPGASGTLALTSDLSGYVTLATAQTISGEKTFSNGLSSSGLTSFNSGGIVTFNGNASINNGLSFSDTGSAAIFANAQSFSVQRSGTTSTINVRRDNVSGSSFTQTLAFSNNAANRTYTFPDASGTVALTSDLSAYLPLTGGTLTGALSGTSATFSSTVSVNSAITTYSIAAIKQTSTQLYGGLSIYSSNGTESFLGIGNSGSVVGFDATYGASGAYLPIAFNVGGSERLRITTGGNIGIGTTSPAQRLSILGNSANSVAVQFNGGYSEQGGLGGDNSVVWIGAGGTSFTNNGLFVSGSSNLLYFSTNGSEKMRITSGGNVGIGTSSPLSITNGTVLHINGTTSGFLTMGYGGTRYLTMLATSGYAAVSTTGAVPLVFETNETERMRITSGGLVLIGATSGTAAYKLKVDNGASGGILAVSSGGGDANFLSSSSGIGYHFFADNGTSARFYVLNNGDVRNTNNSYGAISDISLKENIIDTTPKLDDLLKVKIRNYNLIDDENKTKQLGVIAQELEQIFPNMISNDKVMGTDETIKTVKYSVFVPMLIKAIQEQTQIIKNLEARIVSLESK